jgi:hypothetical protein
MVVKTDRIFLFIVRIEEVEQTNKLLFFINIQLIIFLGNHSNEIHRSSTHSSNHHHHHVPPDGARYSNSSLVSGGGNERHPDNNYNKEIQRAILTVTALTKLQRDVNNILERLNRLEASTHFLQQVYRKKEIANFFIC